MQIYLDYFLYAQTCAKSRVDDTLFWGEPFTFVYVSYFDLKDREIQYCNVIVNVEVLHQLRKSSSKCTKTIIALERKIQRKINVLK